MSTEDSLEIDGARVEESLAELATFHDSTVPGWSREVFSDPYRASRGWIREAMVGAGLEVHTDTAGNIIGRIRGRDPSKPALMTGSHTDTVSEGGRFDGMVGLLSGIEFARRLRETGTTLEHDLLVVDFLGEEANEFGISCLGSRSICGQLTADHLSRVNGAGLRLGDALSQFGIDPDAAVRDAWKPGSVHAYLELHIEQGPLLERSGDQIGVVTAIAGIDRILARFTGSAGHAGTTPMSDRHDALVAAAEAVIAVDRVGCGAPVHGVSTSGRIDAAPGSTNVISGHAQLWAEIRSTDGGWLHGARKQIVDQIVGMAADRGVHVDTEFLTDQDPVPATKSIQDLVASCAGDLGYSWKAVPSGAGHDAAHLAALGPMGMIFIPSVNGLSHCPEEFTATSDIARGAHVLAAALLRLDRQSTPAVTAAH